MGTGHTLSEATALLAERFGVKARLLPMSDGPVTTRVVVEDEWGTTRDLHFQEYWVQRGGSDEVTAVRFDGATEARPAPGVLEAVAEADAVLLCPSNPIVSIDPILAVPGILPALAACRDRVGGVSPIVGGAPLRGMADRLLPAVGVEVSAAGVGSYYAGRGLLGGWVIDEVDRALDQRVRALGLRVSVVDSIMADDAASERVARAALEVALGDRPSG